LVEISLSALLNEESRTAKKSARVSFERIKRRFIIR